LTLAGKVYFLSCLGEAIEQQARKIVNHEQFHEQT